MNWVAKDTRHFTWAESLLLAEGRAFLLFLLTFCFLFHFLLFSHLMFFFLFFLFYAAQNDVSVIKSKKSKNKSCAGHCKYSDFFELDLLMISHWQYFHLCQLISTMMWLMSILTGCMSIQYSHGLHSSSRNQLSVLCSTQV